MRAISLAALLLAGCIDPDAPVNPGSTEVFVFEVPKGASASGLAPTLASEGLVPSAFAWKWFLRSTDGGCLKAGRFEVSKHLSMRELLAVLCGPPIPEDVPFTVVEGWRIQDIDAALVAQGLIDAGAYASLAISKDVALPFEVPGPTLEGYLWPETYRIVPDAFDVKAFIERQVRTFDERFATPYADKLGDRSLHDVVVMASMLEREEPKPSQRAIVAGILWKRIDHGWNLGVDATSRYVLQDWSDRKLFLKQLRDPDDAYNTRLRAGLPPTAIGNPGLESLKAAVAPEDSPHWYYLHDAEGVFHGAKDGAGHAANKRRFNVY